MATGTDKTRSLRAWILRFPGFHTFFSWSPQKHSIRSLMYYVSISMFTHTHCSCLWKREPHVLASKITKGIRHWIVKYYFQVWVQTIFVSNENSCKPWKIVTNIWHYQFTEYICKCTILQITLNYEGWNFNFCNAAVTFDTAHLQSSYFHRRSMYSPKLCRTRSQRWGSRMTPLAAPVLLMVQTERSTAEGLNPPCNCPIQ